MKTSIDHLPKEKQKQILTLKELILQQVPGASVILFGSYARGDWVEDYQETTEYVSDYDLLVVTEHNPELDEQDLQKILRDNIFSPTPTVIMHTLKFVNNKLRRGNYFFVDIVNEGILLHANQHFVLARHEPVDPQTGKKHAREDFDYWFGSANEFLIIS